MTTTDMSNYTLYDTNYNIELAKAEANVAGSQSITAAYTGTVNAGTTILNSGGDYAVQNKNTGYVSIFHLTDPSYITGGNYNQTLGCVIGKSNASSDAISSNYSNTDNDTNTNNNNDSNTNTNTNTTTSSYYGSDIDYYTSLLNSDSDTRTTGSGESASSVATSGKKVTAEQLQELVDQGVYGSLSEALDNTLYNGYEVPDEEQAKLNIYNSNDEARIRSMMNIYGLTREEAIQSLGSKIEDPNLNAQADALEEQLGDVQDEQGFFGKMWNGIKNFFKAGTSSNDAEYAIEMFKKGEMSYDEAQKVIEDYKDKQTKAKGGIKDGLAIGAGALVGLIVGGVPGLIIGSLLGGVVKAGAGYAERATDNIKDNEFSQEMFTDAATGLVDGAIGWTGGRILKAGGKVVKGAKKFVKAKA